MANDEFFMPMQEPIPAPSLMGSETNPAKMCQKGKGPITNPSLDKIFEIFTILLKCWSYT